MPYRHFPQSGFTCMPWKNGGGSTREILRYPEDAGDWQWRLSVADIAADGPFSPFPGCRRSLTLLAGAGMRLQFPDRVEELRPPYGGLRFSGDVPVQAFLNDGPTSDFNAIWRTQAFEITVERRAMHGSLWCIPEPGVSWFVYFLAGTGRIKDDPDSPEFVAGDGLWLQPEAGGARLLLEAHGEALWLRIGRR